VIFSTPIPTESGYPFFNDGTQSRFNPKQVLATQVKTSKQNAQNLEGAFTKQAGGV
jgi:hypothetical protein